MHLQMGPFHILLDKMGLDQMGLNKVGMNPIHVIPSRSLCRTSFCQQKSSSAALGAYGSFFHHFGENGCHGSN